MIINHNLGAMNANRNMGINSANANKSMEKLSSGLRINKAGDDAAGLAISEKMRGQIRGLDQASANAQDGISMIQTAEGALNETHSILQRMRELAVQSANDTNVSVDRGEIQKEMDELAKEVTRISNNTEFNTQKLINGAITDNGIGSAKFHIGANSSQDITLSINAMDSKSLGISRDIATATIDPTNAAGVKNALVDSVDVTKTLTEAVYNVKVADTVAGATVTAGSGSTIGLATPTGTPSADFSLTLTYHDTVAGANSQATVEAASSTADTLTINYGVAGNKNNLKVNLTTATDDNLAVTFNGTDTINIALADTTATKNTAALITTALQGIGNETAAGFDFTAMTATAAGSWDSAAIATGEAGAINFAGGATAAAANWTTSATSGDVFRSTYAVGASIDANGATIDLSTATGLGAGNDGKSITITGGTTTAQLFAEDGTTAIGNAVYINKANGGSFTVGDTTTGQAKLAFAAGAAKTGTSTITVDSAAATSATKLAGGAMSDATVGGGLNVSSQSTASAAISTIQSAIETVSAERSKLGAYQNRLEHTIANLGTSSENLTSAESRIRDVNMAKEMSTFSKNNILSQAAQAMLAQANQQPQQVLQLLR